jgi:hypothetical protein
MAIVAHRYERRPRRTEITAVETDRPSRSTTGLSDDSDVGIAVLGRLRLRLR